MHITIKTTMQPVLVLSQLSSKKEAVMLAELLVLEHLAACVHIFPKGESLYIWEGQLTSHEEYLVQIKTLKKHFASITMKIQQTCSYSCPEVLLVPIEKGNPEYLQWLQHQCSKS